MKCYTGLQILRSSAMVLHLCVSGDKTKISQLQWYAIFCVLALCFYSRTPYIEAALSTGCTKIAGPQVPGSGVGHEEEIGGLRSYITGSSNSKAAVLLVSDVIGYEAPKLRKLADKIASYGYYVAVPDFFQGDYAVDGVTNITEWLKKHTHDQGFEHAKPVIEALKSKGFTKVGVAGFCWGGKVAVELSKYACNDATVLCHPASVTVEDIQVVKVPIMILGAEIDQVTPPELVKKFEEALNAKPDIDSFVKIFLGTTHGWTLRYNDEDDKEVKLAEEAHRDLIHWFGKYLK